MLHSGLVQSLLLPLLNETAVLARTPAKQLSLQAYHVQPSMLAAVLVSYAQRAAPPGRGGSGGDGEACSERTQEDWGFDVAQLLQVRSAAAASVG